MSSVLTFVKVAGRGALAGPDGTVAGLAATETRTSTTRRKRKTGNKRTRQRNSVKMATKTTTSAQAAPQLSSPVLGSSIC